MIWQRSTMRTLFAAVLVLLAIAAPARAQTVLDLSATGTTITKPDEMVASFTAQATARTAATAQAQVNRLMQNALAAAHAVNGVVAATADYSVQQNDDDRNGQPISFQASQTLNLTMPAPGGVPPDEFTNLAGGLQRDGLLLGNFDGQLSAAGADAASQTATVDAIHRLRTMAAAVAATLGDKIGEIKTLNLTDNNSGPISPQPMMMLDKSAPPQAAPGPVTVQVTVEATIALNPAAP